MNPGPTNFAYRRSTAPTLLTPLPIPRSNLLFSPSPLPPVPSPPTTPISSTIPPSPPSLPFSTPSPTPLSTTTFEKDFGRSTTTFSDGRIASISVVPRASTRQETRIFRVDIANVKEDLHRHPAVLFWEMGGKKYAGSKGVGDYELVDGERRAYAVVLTAHHKSVKKLGRLHFLVEPGEGLVEVVMGSLLAVWGKADRDVRSGHVGLRT